MAEDKTSGGGIDFNHIQGNVSLNADGDIVAGNKTTIIHYGEEKKVIPRQPYEPETLPVAEGSFLMGNDAANGTAADETPQHQLHLDAYNIAKFPVTNEQFFAFIVQSGEAKRTPKHWALRKPSKKQLQLPVVMISWEDAVSYCQWLTEQTGRNYALPTEAQWEKAARGDTGQQYPWGNQWLDDHCNDSGRISAVDAHPDGVSPFGCMDMLGNTQEWCQTAWGDDPQHSNFPYPYQTMDGREAMHAGDFRIVRGGSYKEDAAALRCSARAFAASQSKVQWRGFRVVEY